MAYETVALTGKKMHLISILMVAAVAVALIPEAVSGECYDGAESVKLTTDKKWIDAAIAKHNEYRLKHGVCPLTFNQKLSEIAQRWACHLASTKTFEHSHTKCLGENLATQGSTVQDSKVMSDFAEIGWYDEIKDYDFNSGQSRGGVVGHLTQLLWKESREVGIAYASYKVNTDGREWTHYVVVAEYFPAGNYVGENTKNVFAAGSPLPGECKDAKSPSSDVVIGDINKPDACSSDSSQANPTGNSSHLQMLSFWITATASLVICFIS